LDSYVWAIRRADIEVRAAYTPPFAESREGWGTRAFELD
jgi:hypothetical protein